MIPDPLHAVIFDMDGLLLDTERVFHAVMTDACADLGYPMDQTLFLSMIGSPRDANAARLKAHYGEDFPLDAYYAACGRGFEIACAQDVPLRPGVVRLLDLLQRRAIPRAVATSSHAAHARAILERAGLIGYFGAIVTRDDVERGKPHPDTFLVAARRLGADPSACIGLEDSFQGVRAVAAAGMSVVMVPDFLQPTAEIRALCAAVLGGLDDLADALEAREATT
jgi:HAD superfamily hydrolase (TIGR01509 family)